MFQVVLFILAAIGIGMVIRRTLILTGVIQSVNPRGGAPFDTGFGKHPAITLLHILPGFLFMSLAPVLFIPGIREKKSQFYIICQRLFIIIGFIIGLSAIIMPFIMIPIGGINEAAASILFAILFIIFLRKAWVANNRKQMILYREWMLRSLAIGVAISTVRPIMVLFFALTKLPPSVFFGTAFWIGFTIHLIVAEFWINYTRNPIRDF